MKFGNQEKELVLELSSLYASLYQICGTDSTTEFESKVRQINILSLKLNRLRRNSI
jgi:hypothetical protein